MRFLRRSRRLEGSGESLALRLRAFGEGGGDGSSAWSSRVEAPARLDQSSAVGTRDLPQILRCQLPYFAPPCNLLGQRREQVFAKALVGLLQEQ